MFESVFQIRKQTGLVEELRGLKPTEAPAKFFCRLIRDALEQHKGNILSNNGGGLEKPLLLRRKSVDPSSQHRLHRRRHLCRPERVLQPIASSLSPQNSCFDKRPDSFFYKESISFGSVEQYPL